MKTKSIQKILEALHSEHAGVLLLQRTMVKGVIQNLTKIRGRFIEGPHLSDGKDLFVVQANEHLGCMQFTARMVYSLSVDCDPEEEIPWATIVIKRFEGGVQVE